MGPVSATLDAKSNCTQPLGRGKKATVEVEVEVEGVGDNSGTIGC